MPDVANRQLLFRLYRDAILAKNALLATSAVDRDGADANLFGAGGAAMGDEVMAQQIRFNAGLFLDSSKGAALDRVVFDRYGLIRNPASAAVGSVNFSLPANPGTAFAIPAGTLLSGPNGAQYVTTSTIIFPTTTNGQPPNTLVTAAIRSVLAGAAQQAAIGSIAVLISQVALPVGVVGPLAVVNSLATAGAADGETDAQLRARARAFFVNARRGTLGAIKNGALGVPGVVTAETFETVDGPGQPARFVQLVVADQFTLSLLNASSIPPSYQTQSQVLAQMVSDALLEIRAGGITVSVTVAKVALLPIVLALTFTADNPNPDRSALMARAAMVGYVNGLSPGDSFVPADAIPILQGVPGLAVTGREILSPPGTQLAAQVEALRTTLGLVTTTSAATNVSLTATNTPA